MGKEKIKITCNEQQKDEEEKVEEEGGEKKEKGNEIPVSTEHIMNIYCLG